MSDFSVNCQIVASMIESCQLQMAQSLLRDLHQHSETEYSTNSPEHQQILLLIGRWHSVAGEYAAALPLLTRVAQDKTNTMAQIDLAQLHRLCGRYNEAHAILETVYHTNRLPETLPELAAAQHEMGCILLGLEQIHDALTQFERAAETYQMLHGNQHLHTVRAFRHVATVYRIQNNRDTALSVLNSLLPICENLYPFLHPETAEILAEIAQIHDEQGHFEAAAPLYSRAINVINETLGHKHPNFARLLCRHAIHFMQQKQPEQTLPLLHQAVVIYFEVFEKDHPAVQNLLHFIVLMQLAAGGLFPDTDTPIQ